jgi:hypothetical protein
MYYDLLEYLKLPDAPSKDPEIENIRETISLYITTCFWMPRIDIFILFFMYGASEDPFATAGLNILLYEFEYVMQYPRSAPAPATFFNSA